MQEKKKPRNCNLVSVVCSKEPVKRFGLFMNITTLFIGDEVSEMEHSYSTHCYIMCLNDQYGGSVDVCHMPIVCQMLEMVCSTQNVVSKQHTFKAPL